MLSSFPVIMLFFPGGFISCPLGWSKSWKILFKTAKWARYRWTRICNLRIKHAPLYLRHYKQFSLFCMSLNSLWLLLLYKYCCYFATITNLSVIFYNFYYHFIITNFLFMFLFASCILRKRSSENLHTISTLNVSGCVKHSTNI